MGDWHIVSVTKCDEISPKPGGKQFATFLSLKLEPYGEATCSQKYPHLWLPLKEAFGGHGQLTVEIEDNDYNGKTYHNVVDVELAGGSEEGEQKREERRAAPPTPPGPAAGPSGDPREKAKELAQDIRALICVGAGLLCNSSPGSRWDETIKMCERYVLTGELK